MGRHLKAEQLSRWVDQMAPAGVSEDLKSHLSGCADCRRKQEAFSAVKGLLGGLPVLREGPLSHAIPAVTATPAFPSFWWKGGILLVSALGGLWVGWLLWRPTVTPWKVISAQGNAVQAPVQVQEGGNVDLEIPGRVLLRLRPGSTITWEEMNPPLGWGRRLLTVNLLSGEILGRTQQGFWGSELRVRTPMAMMTIHGTAFSIAIEGLSKVTTVKVLAGSVLFSPRSLPGVGVRVKSGQKSRIQENHLPTLPQELSVEERADLLESYRVGGDPLAAVVMGDGPERVEELLRTASFYVSRRAHPALHPFIRKKIEELNQALLRKNAAASADALRGLEETLGVIQEPRLIVPLQLFVGAAAARQGDVKRAHAHFEKILQEFPKDPLGSVALAAIGVTAEQQLYDLNMAHQVFDRLLAEYPRSPEAALAKEFLKRYR